MRLDYDSGTPGEYAGFDRFGRVIDHLWYAYAASADRDRYTYGYDRASNRLYRENSLTSGRDELYGYDQGNRLVEFARGNLNNPKSAIENPNSAVDWSLDMTGNWPGFVQKTSGSTDLDQSRTHNPVNEITTITATTGTDWADPEHDRAGNMTTIPKPANLADGLTATYDAWNRLVEVKDRQTVIARYEYDGLNRRIKSHIDSGAPSNPSGIDTYLHYYHNSAWQILETRQTDTESAAPETLQPKHQYVWSRRYIDSAVLRDENTDTNGLCDDERLYYLNDANFNVTALVDTSGDAVERYLYSPYGVVTIYDATWTNTRNESSYANVTLYTGRELDSETGLYYYRNRYYGAELGRFVSRDPIGYQAGDVSLYCYRGNAPTVYLDPSGLTVEVLPPEILGVDTFDTWIRRPLLLGQHRARFDWRDREPVSARVLLSLPVPFFVCNTCKLFVASCTVDREAVGVSQIFYYRVVRDRLPLQFRGLVDELNAQVEWEETAHEAARALQRTIEASRIAALAATNALIDAIGYQQRLNIRRRAFELVERLQ